MTKGEIIKAAESFDTPGLTGRFITDREYSRHADLDGTEARRFLESRGFNVIRNYDTGRNGLAITACGVHLSTNGYIYKKK